MFTTPCTPTLTKVQNVSLLFVISCFTDVGFCVVSGSKHKTMLEARSGAGPIKAYPRPGAKLKSGSSSSLKGSGLQNKTFHCQICDVHVNSEIQLKQVETHSGHIHYNNIILTLLVYTDLNLFLLMCSSENGS